MYLAQVVQASVKKIALNDTSNVANESSIPPSDWTKMKSAYSFCFRSRSPSKSEFMRFASQSSSACPCVSSNPSRSMAITPPKSKPFPVFNNRSKSERSVDTNDGNSSLFSPVPESYSLSKALPSVAVMPKAEGVDNSRMHKVPMSASEVFLFFGIFDPAFFVVIVMALKRLVCWTAPSSFVCSS